MKLFEGLNSEKPTPIFLALAKNRNTSNLSLMKDDTGSEFTSPAEQGEYIASYYKISTGLPLMRTLITTG